MLIDSLEAMVESLWPPVLGKGRLRPSGIGGLSPDTSESSENTRDSVSPASVFSGTFSGASSLSFARRGDLLCFLSLDLLLPDGEGLWSRSRMVGLSSVDLAPSAIESLLLTPLLCVLFRLDRGSDGESEPVTRS